MYHYFTDLDMNDMIINNNLFLCKAEKPLPLISIEASDLATEVTPKARQNF